MTEPTTPMPFDEGETLLVSDRNATERLRIALKSYKGRSYVDARIEFKPHGETRWLGTKKGFSIRMRELADVAAALNKALERIAENPPPR